LTLRIARGDTGTEVRDLQQRLTALGLATVGDDLGVFGPTTEAAVRAFQAERGLRVDGICGRHTWAALVESGFSLGDRLLYHRASAMLRGDDVGDLQRRLNALGFDPGREDRIFGARTDAALREFQRNAGVSIDGVCGPATIAALHRLGHLAAGSVAGLREREMLRATRGRLAGRKVYLAVEPGLEVLGDVVSRGLTTSGVDLLIHAVDADDTAMAEEANKYESDVFVGLRFGDEPGFHCDFFTGRATRSEAGYRLATLIVEELAAALGTELDCPRGRSYGALRETRMPAVVCQPARADDADELARVVAVVPTVGHAVVRGVRRAIEEPYAE
jgi:N-acetylmuramoyl-L-alanine amidase